MNKTNLFAVISSVKSGGMVPLVVPFIVDARAAINLLRAHGRESGSVYVKESSLELFIEDRHFKFFALSTASDPKEFVQRLSGLMCPGFIIDSKVLEFAGAEAGSLLAGLQCRIRTVPPEKPFNFIFV